MEQNRRERLEETVSRRTVLRGIVAAGFLIKTAGAAKIVEASQAASSDEHIYSASESAMGLPPHQVREAEPNPYERPDFGVRWLPETVTRWHELIRKSGEAHDVDPRLISIIMTLESGGWADAVSPVGAQGLMQVMPETGKDIARWQDVTEYDIKDPETNIDFGACYLGYLFDRFQPEEEDISTRTVELVSTGYNGGPGRTENLLNGGEIPRETSIYKMYATGFWDERDEEYGESFERWRSPEYGDGQWLIDHALEEM